MRIKYAYIGLFIAVLALVYIEFADIDKTNQNANINTYNNLSQADEDKRIQMGHSLKIKEAQEVLELWAKGVRERNALIQYGVMNKALKERYYPIFEDLNWVTGTSSPWIIGYNIELLEEAENKRIYLVEFELMDSTKSVYKQKNRITAEKFNEYWLLTDIE